MSDCSGRSFCFTLQFYGNMDRNIENNAATDDAKEYAVVSAFSKDGKGGNRAGIVCGGFSGGGAAKTEFAARLGYSETVFASDSDVADYRLEYFTPEGEVPLCGHATIAFFVYMLETGRIGPGHYVIETGAGLLGVDVEPDGMVFMEQARPEFLETVPPERLAGCFSPMPSRTEIVPRIVSTGLRDILLPVASVAELDRMRMDREAVSSLSAELGCVGIHCFALCNAAGGEAFRPVNAFSGAAVSSEGCRVSSDKSFAGEFCTAVCRNFAPLYGIDEESATGTSNCALACYLFKCGIRLREYVFEQGRNLSSVSRIVVRLTTSGDEILSVRVGGRGYLL